MFSSLSSAIRARIPSKDISCLVPLSVFEISFFSGCPILNGSVIVTVVPLPFLLFISMVPSILSTIFLAIARPSPAPSYLVLLVSFSWENISNAWLINSSLMPIPLSSHTNSYITWLSSTDFSQHHTCIVPPGSVNFTALSATIVRSRSK